MREAKATLIVTPSTIVSQWQNEIHRHAPHLGDSVFVYPGHSQFSKMTETLDFLATRSIILVTYEVMAKEYWQIVGSARRNPESILSRLQFWRVVLDEVQLAPDRRNAGRAVRVIPSVNRWAVSGTPMRRGKPGAGPGDIGQLLGFIGGRELEKKWLSLVHEAECFQEAQCCVDDSRRAMLDLLKPLFLRRLKLDVASQMNLPQQHIEIIYVTPTPAELALREIFVLPRAREAAADVDDALLRKHIGLSCLSPSQWIRWCRQEGQKKSKNKKEINKLAGAFKATSFDTAAVSLIECLEKGAKIELDKAVRDLRYDVRDAVIGFLPHEEDRGVAAGDEREQQRKQDRDRRLAGGAKAAVIICRVQQLVASSAIARLTSSMLVMESMEHVFMYLQACTLDEAQKTYLNGQEDETLLSKARFAVLRSFIEGLNPSHADKQAGLHDIPLQSGGSKTITIPAYVREFEPRCWADLDVLLRVQFRGFTKAEAKQEHEDSLGLAIVSKRCTKIHLPEDGVWVGRPNAKTAQGTGACRLLCLRPLGSPALLFALATQLGDAVRALEEMRKEAGRLLDTDAWSRDGVLRTRIEKWPYILDTVSEATLEGLLAMPPRLCGLDDARYQKPILPLRNGKPDASALKKNFGLKCENLPAVLSQHGYSSIEAFVQKVRLKGREIKTSVTHFVRNGMRRRAGLVADADRSSVRYRDLGFGGFGRRRQIITHEYGSSSNDELNAEQATAVAAAEVELVHIEEEGDEESREEDEEDSESGSMAVSSSDSDYDDSDDSDGDDDDDEDDDNDELEEEYQELIRSLYQSQVHLPAKVQALVDLISRKPAEKFVVFTAFKEAVLFIENELSSLLDSDEPTVLSCTTPAEFRQKPALFCREASYRVLVLQASDQQAGAGAAGLTLNAASNVVLLDVLPDPAIEMQAIGRVHRVGQEKESVVWHIVSRGSMDVLQRLQDSSRAEKKIGPLLQHMRTLPSHAEIDDDETAAVLVAADRHEIEDLEAAEEDAVDPAAYLASAQSPPTASSSAAPVLSSEEGTRNRRLEAQPTPAEQESESHAPVRHLEAEFGDEGDSMDVASEAAADAEASGVHTERDAAGMLA